MNPVQPKNTHNDKQTEELAEKINHKVTNELHTSHRSLLKNALIIIGFSILGLIILVILVIFFQSYLRKQEIKKQAKAAPQKIASSRTLVEQTADQELEQIENLFKKVGIVDQQIASSKVDVCYVTHSDQGLFAYTYFQDCYLRYTQGYTTKLNKNELKQKLLAQPEAASLFNKENKNADSVLDDCELYQKAYTDTTNKGDLTYRPANAVGNGYSCKIPNPLQGLFSVKGPTVLDDELAVKVYRTYDASKINNSTNQFWLSFDEYYYHEDLGCSTGLIFCENPRPKPIQAP